MVFIKALSIFYAGGLQKEAHRVYKDNPDRPFLHIIGGISAIGYTLLYIGLLYSPIVIIGLIFEGFEKMMLSAAGFGLLIVMGYITVLSGCLSLRKIIRKA